MKGHVYAFGDSLRFEGLYEDCRDVTFTVPRDSVAQVRVKRFSVIRTAGLLLVGAGIGMLAAVAAALESGF